MRQASRVSVSPLRLSGSCMAAAAFIVSGNARVQEAAAYTRLTPTCKDP